MQELRNKLKSIEKLTYLHDRKFKHFETIRTMKFYEILSNEIERNTDLRKASIDLDRIKNHINLKISQL